MNHVLPALRTRHHADVALQDDEPAARLATAQAISNGARIAVTARDTSDVRTVAQIRGLAFAGLMTEGDHHATHHLALARGDSGPHVR